MLPQQRYVCIYIYIHKYLLNDRVSWFRPYSHLIPSPIIGPPKPLRINVVPNIYALIYTKYFLLALGNVEYQGKGSTYVPPQQDIL